MRYFYDTEFIEDGSTIDLISIGIVAEDGREYYAVASDAPWRRIKRHEWLMANVVPSLPQPHGDWANHMPKRWPIDFWNPSVKRKSKIADEVRAFLLAGGKPELWAWYSAYDHVVLCQMWGTMMQFPEGVPMYTGDIKQECDRLSNPSLPGQPDGEHNALADARHNKVRWDFLRGLGEAGR